MSELKEEFEWMSSDQMNKQKPSFLSKLTSQDSKPSLPKSSDSTNVQNITFKKPEGVDWIQLNKDMDEVSSFVYTETYGQKLLNKMKQEPLVPIGTLATIAALTRGIYHFSVGGRAKEQQKMMRWRVGSQGFTILAALGGYMYYQEESLPWIEPAISGFKSITQYISNIVNPDKNETENQNDVKLKNQSKDILGK